MFLALKLQRGGGGEGLGGGSHALLALVAFLLASACFRLLLASAVNLHGLLLLASAAFCFYLSFFLFFDESSRWKYSSTSSQSSHQ